MIPIETHTPKERLRKDINKESTAKTVVIPGDIPKLQLLRDIIRGFTLHGKYTLRNNPTKSLNKHAKNSKLSPRKTEGKSLTSIAAPFYLKYSLINENCKNYKEARKCETYPEKISGNSNYL